MENALREPWNNNSNDSNQGDGSIRTSKSSGQTQPSSSGGNSSAPNSSTQSTPIWLSDEIEYWPDRNLKFTAISALHSELVAIGVNGAVYQWKWIEVEPYRNPEVSF